MREAEPVRAPRKQPLDCLFFARGCCTAGDKRRFRHASPFQIREEEAAGALRAAELSYEQLLSQHTATARASQEFTPARQATNAMSCAAFPTVEHCQDAVEQDVVEQEVEEELEDGEIEEDNEGLS